MIPKIIHYCWFGRGPKPGLAQKCIESWKQWCPDYEIVEWNEDNFDIHSNPYVEQAYEARRFAFVSDYVRLFALYSVGGIYMDTDVMAVKSLDFCLQNEACFGFESNTHVSTGTIASEKAHPVIGNLLSYYDEAQFLRDDGSYNLTTNVETITTYFLAKGLVANDAYQQIEGVTIYPKRVFCPEHKRLDDSVYMAEAATIHYFAGSWRDEKTAKRQKTLWWRYLVIPASKVSRKLEKMCGKPYSWLKEHLRRQILEK